MNSEVHMNILYAQIQSNTAKMIERRLVQMDDDPKHTAKTTQEFLSDLNLIEHAFHLLKTKLKTERATNKQQLKSAVVKSWQSITKEETGLW